MTEVTPPVSDGQRALKHPAISFEFFPPKTEEMEKSLWDTIKRLAPLAPSFVSVTYGAGGSTRERTHSTIARILAETDLLPAAHLTCVGAARGEIDEIVAAITTSASATSWRCAAIRPAASARPTPPIPMATRPRPSSWPASRRRYPRYRGLGFGLSGEAPGKPGLRCRYRRAQGQGRCRRDPRHHPGVLR